LDSNGNAKICDFGLCKKFDVYAINTSRFGTINYRAPEAFIFDSVLNYSVDYWSLGVCTYEMLTGSFPFDDEENIKNKEKMTDPRDKRILKDSQHEISLSAVEFVSNLLINEPNERLGSKNIKNYPFFSDIDWNKLESGEMEPAFKLNVLHITTFILDLKFIFY